MTEEIPEFMEYPDTKEFFENKEWKTNYFAYSFYAIFSRYLIYLLKQEVQDVALPAPPHYGEIIGGYKTRRDKKEAKKALKKKHRQTL